MAKYSSSENALNEILDVIQNNMDEKNSDLNIFIGKEKMDICNDFVILFYNSLLSIINEYNLSKTDIKAILQILEYMQYGNLVRMSYAQLARDIGVDPSNINKTIRKLKQSNLLIERESSLYLNPHIISKGRFKRKDNNATELLEYSAKLLEDSNIAPSILTPKLRKKLNINKDYNNFKNTIGVING